MIDGQAFVDLPIFLKLPANAFLQHTGIVPDWTPSSGPKMVRNLAWMYLESWKLTAFRFRKLEVSYILEVDRDQDHIPSSTP